jgi:RHS repeat-associated protein
MAALAVAIVAAPRAHAAPDARAVALPASEGEANPFWGSYRQSIPIAVPAFHGLEPQLALSYDSSGGNGFAGTGWRLAGFSSIERTSPGGGIPRYDDGDGYRLDGEELIPCPPGGSSPSCRAGGTHFTRTESFERIQQVAAVPGGAAWVVTGRDGTQRTYTPIGDIPLEWTTALCDEPAPCGTAAVSVAGGGWAGACQPFTGPVAAPNITGDGNRILFHTSAGANSTCDFAVTLTGATVSGWVAGWPTSINAAGGTLAFGDAAGRSLGTLTLVGATASGQVALGVGLQTVQASGGAITFSGGGRSGTVTLAGAAGCSPQRQCRPGIYRYGLSSVSDRRGNTVRYGWQCTEYSYGSIIPPGCYPASVDYNGTHIALYAEPRPDTMSRSIGGTSTFVWQRLKTVDVQTGGARVRAYGLSYTQSGSTGRSLLAAVQQFGRDAMLDANGTVTGGTALPAMGATYTAGQTAFAFNVWTAAAGWGPLFDTRSPARTFTGDFNGDGRQDVMFTWVDGSFWIGLSDGTRFNFSRWNLMAGWAGLLNATSPHRIFVADFDGDGKDDVMLAFNNGQIYVGTSNGSTFNFQPWYINAGWGGVLDSRSAARIFAEDVDGDGKTDVLFTWPEPNGSATIWVGLSNGSRFDFAGFANFPGWGPIVHAGSSARVLPADIDGDGRRDLVLLRNDGTVWVARGDGRSFSLFRFSSSDPAGFGQTEVGAGRPRPSFGSALDASSNARVLVGDFNGDGSSDLLIIRPTATTPSAAELWIGISIGSRFDWSLGQSTWGWGPIADAHGDGRWFVGDFNGDGKSDVLFNWTDGSFWVGTAPGAQTMSFARWTRVPGWSSVLGAHTPARVHLGDFDGDGRLDYGFAWPDGTWWIGPSAGATPDLMTSFTNGLGGTTTIAYTPSSAWPSANAPPISPTVASVTVDDGGGGAATTRYQYAGGYYDAAERRFLGFGYLKQLLPCLTGETDCPYLETWFRQTYGSLARPQRVDRRTQSGALLSSTLYEYNASAAPPFVSQETGRWEYLYDGVGAACPGNCKRTYLSRAYDSWGNLTLETSYGDYDVAGDERTTQTVYVPNQSDYLVGLPAAVQTFAGTFAQGDLLEQTLYCYDGQARWDQAPPAGNRTQTLRWHDQSASYTVSRDDYDAFGNVIVHADETGGRDNVTFDATYHAFAQLRTNAVGHLTLTDWDPVCGVPLRTTDPNRHDTLWTYDALCRVVRADLPDGGFRITSYLGFGDPSAQMVMTETPAASGGGTLWSQRFFDGLGRLRVESARGPSASRTILARTEYNARGGVARRSSPYYAGDAPEWTTYAYDALDRPIQALYADGTHDDYAHLLRTDVHTDPAAHLERDVRDGRGRLVEHDEQLGGSWLATQYAWDLRDHPTGIVDVVGNRWQMQYDSLGRRVRIDDPDRGLWTLDYDAAGRERSHTDALGQRTDTVYDGIGRPLTKTSRAGAAGTQTVGWRYDEPRDGYANVGHLTSMNDAGGQATFDYDVAGRQVRIVRTIDGARYELARSWDAGGRLLSSTAPEDAGPATVQYQYDEAGRVAALPGLVTQVVWDAGGQLVEQHNANGTATTRSYGAGRHLLAHIQTTGPDGLVQDSVFERDRDGLITAIDSPFPDESWLYGYDELHRLVDAVDRGDDSHNRTFRYDSIGNLVESSIPGACSYPAPGERRPHAVSACAGGGFSYDGNGSLVGAPGRTLVYDGDNRPVGINDLQIVYDADGSRIKTAHGDAIVHYVGDDLQVSAGAVSRTITLGGAPLAERSAGSTRWLHTDHLGAVQVVTDADGQTVERDDSGPYREPLDSTLAGETAGPASGDADGGLEFMHARYYDPALGRFVMPDARPDPMQTTGLNSYAYAANNPVNLVDSTGLEPEGNPFYVAPNAAVGPQGWDPTAAGWAYPGSPASQAQAEVLKDQLDRAFWADTSMNNDYYRSASSAYHAIADRQPGAGVTGSLFAGSPFAQPWTAPLFSDGGLMPSIADAMHGIVPSFAPVPNILDAGLGPLSATLGGLTQQSPPTQILFAGGGRMAARPTVAAPPPPPPPPLLVQLPAAPALRATVAAGDPTVGVVDRSMRATPATGGAGPAPRGLLIGAVSLAAAVSAPGRPAAGNAYDATARVGVFPSRVQRAAVAATDRYLDRYLAYLQDKAQSALGIAPRDVSRLSAADRAALARLLRELLLGAGVDFEQDMASGLRTQTAQIGGGFLDGLQRGLQARLQAALRRGDAAEIGNATDLLAALGLLTADEQRSVGASYVEWVIQLDDRKRLAAGIDAAGMRASVDAYLQRALVELRTNLVTAYPTMTDDLRHRLAPWLWPSDPKYAGLFELEVDSEGRPAFYPTERLLRQQFLQIAAMLTLKQGIDDENRYWYSRFEPPDTTVPGLAFLPVTPDDAERAWVMFSDNSPNAIMPKAIQSGGVVQSNDELLFIPATAVGRFAKEGGLLLFLRNAAGEVTLMISINGALHAASQQFGAAAPIAALLLAVGGRPVVARVAEMRAAMRGPLERALQQAETPASEAIVGATRERLMEIRDLPLADRADAVGEIIGVGRDHSAFADGYLHRSGPATDYNGVMDEILDFLLGHPTVAAGPNPARVLVVHGGPLLPPDMLEAQGLLPTGELLARGQVPFSGEVSNGIIPGGGINNGAVSTMVLNDKSAEAVEYALMAKDGWTPQVGQQLIDGIDRVLPNFPENSLNGRALRANRDIQVRRLEAWPQLTPAQQEMFANPIPAVYGTNTGRDVYLLIPSQMSEVGVKAVPMDQISTIWVRGQDLDRARTVYSGLLSRYPNLQIRNLEELQR